MGAVGTAGLCACSWRQSGVEEKKRVGAAMGRRSERRETANDGRATATER